MSMIAIEEGRGTMAVRRLHIVLGIGLVSLLIGSAMASRTPAFNPDPVSVGVANWASSAVTVADQVAEADLVVHAKVVKVHEARKLRQVAPRYSADGKVDGHGVDILPFTDSEMLVLEVYKGSSEQHITVMQTGGALPAGDGDPAINIVTPEDPIFVEGHEYMLFLKDISGDAVHGRGRRLYRAVNPAGRYAIQGTEVFSPSEFPEWFTPPRTLDELVDQITQALTRQ